MIVDSSVLIALLDTADAHHARAVDEVEAADHQSADLIAPASAYSETLVAFARGDRIPDAREAITAMGITVSPLDPTTAERAAELRARHDRLRLPDAMVLATAQQWHGQLMTYDHRLERYAASEAADTTGQPEADDEA